MMSTTSYLLSLDFSHMYPFQKLLDLLVDKSNNLTVDQLERLYSLLSQCIYRHRKDYDKSQLVEVSVFSVCEEINAVLLILKEKEEKLSKSIFKRFNVCECFACVNVCVPQVC